MSSLTTTYVGLKPKSPIIAGSAEVTENLKRIKRLRMRGCSAVVIKSVFIQL